MAASYISSSLGSGFISGDMYAAIHVDYLSENFFDDLSNAIDDAAGEAQRELMEEALRDTEWEPVAPYLFTNVRGGELMFTHGGSGDVDRYVSSLEFGDETRPPNALLRKQVRRAAETVNDRIKDFMIDEVSLG